MLLLLLFFLLLLLLLLFLWCNFFVKLLSDNMPERLNRLILYPTAWYGAFLWSCIKVFVDVRTQEKVLLLGSGEVVEEKDSKREFVPKTIDQYVDLTTVPVRCGGTNIDPPLDLMKSFIHES
jgi:hypothetical protein